MTPKPRSAEYFDRWYADKSAAPQVGEIMNRHLGLLDLACGRAWYGLEIAARAGARLIGVDFSAEAVRQAGERARLHHRDAEFKTGDLTASLRSLGYVDGLRRVMAAATAP
jgi:ubiquinone/menaquinone biosynthesis C-methylase UbiE